MWTKSDEKVTRNTNIEVKRKWNNMIIKITEKNRNIYVRITRSWDKGETDMNCIMLVSKNEYDNWKNQMYMIYIIKNYH